MNNTQKALINQDVCEQTTPNLGITQSSGLDRHCIYARQRVDVFKDATDLVCQPPSAWDADCRNLIRRLTPLECERLQGYPDGWTDVPSASDSARYKALGNSVAIPCVEYLMQRVAMVITLGLEWEF